MEETPERGVPNKDLYGEAPPRAPNSYTYPY